MIRAYVFWLLLGLFLTNRAELWYLRRLLSIDFDAFKKSYFWRENGCGRHAGAKWSGASGSNQKVGPLDDPFCSTTICF